MAQEGFEAALEFQLIEERAGALGRTGRRLQKALDALAAAPADDPSRPQLVRRAGVCLWELVVVREASGFTRYETIDEAWDIPPEVRLAMGPR